MTNIPRSYSEEKTDRQKERENALVFSYITLRNLIGFCGMLLPLLLVLTTQRALEDKNIEPSISDYYYTSNGDVVVVLLSILGVFLFTYKGYNWKENALTIIAALCSIGVAFSPTVTKYERSSFSVHTTNEAVPKMLGVEQHLIFAAVFFIALAFISLIFFPKSDVLPNTQFSHTKNAKQKRNIVFKICGWVMLICVILMAVYFISGTIQKRFGSFPIIFWLETIAIEAFGISWITKGETLWPDGEHYLLKGYRQARIALEKTI